MRFIIFFFLVSVLYSCSPGDDEPMPGPIPFFFIADLNGNKLAFGAPSELVGGYANEPFEEIVPVEGDSVRVYRGTAILPVPGGPAGSATVSVLRIFDHPPSPLERSLILDTGFYRYALSDSLMTGGASIRFTDGNGIFWTTEDHQQQDTLFRIEAIIDNPETGPGKTMQARFRCLLFNQSGDSMLLENGAVRGQIPQP